MTPRTALSTPRPLSRKREHGKQRTAIALASIDGKAITTEKRGRAPAKSIQTDDALLTQRTPIQKHEAPRARRKPIQENDALAVTRQGRAERIAALRATIRNLVVEISHAADVELLDLMADEVGSFARHKAAQEARTWAATAGVTLETGLMQLDRAIPTRSK